MGGKKSKISPQNDNFDNSVIINGRPTVQDILSAYYSDSITYNIFCKQAVLMQKRIGTLQLQLKKIVYNEGGIVVPMHDFETDENQILENIDTNLIKIVYEACWPNIHILHDSDFNEHTMNQINQLYTVGINIIFSKGSLHEM